MIADEGALRIVFDFGGVLFNWQPLELVRRYLPRQAVDAASTGALVADVFQGFGGDWAQFDRGALDDAELVRRIAARTGLPAREVAALVDGVPPSLTPKPDTVALLRRLRAAGTPLHFLSNMPRPYAEHLDRTHPDLMGHFRSGLYSSHVRLIKPEGEAVRVGEPNVSRRRPIGWCCSTTSAPTCRPRAPTAGRPCNSPMRAAASRRCAPTAGGRKGRDGRVGARRAGISLARDLSGPAARRRAPAQRWPASTRRCRCRRRRAPGA